MKKTMQTQNNYRTKNPTKINVSETSPVLWPGLSHSSRKAVPHIKKPQGLDMEDKMVQIKKETKKDKCKSARKWLKF